MSMTASHMGRIGVEPRFSSAVAAKWLAHACRERSSPPLLPVCSRTDGLCHWQLVCAVSAPGVLVYCVSGRPYCTAADCSDTAVCCRLLHENRAISVPLAPSVCEHLTSRHHESESDCDRVLNCADCAASDCDCDCGHGGDAHAPPKHARGWPHRGGEQHTRRMDDRRYCTSETCSKRHTVRALLHRHPPCTA